MPRHGGTILVVDDDPHLTEVLDQALTEVGYRVLTAPASQTVAVARAGQPDLIQLDLVMPGLDGAALSRALRADRATAAIPIVLMSVYGARADATRQLPVTDQLPKPFDLEALYGTVGRWLPPG
jgi:two-component system alkaline phosphatase synthesis response regulator PhoP